MRFKHALLAGLSCLLLVPAAAQATTFTLDGNSVSEKAAYSGSAGDGGGCAAMPSTAGVVACFTTEGKQTEALNSSLRSNKTPPGFGVKPSASLRASLLGATVSRSKRPRARAACSAQYTHQHNGYNRTGYYTYFYSTSGWTNEPAAANNAISSVFIGNGNHWSQWHDLPGGHGNFLDLSNGACNAYNNLGVQGWDNRFSSYNG